MTKLIAIRDGHGQETAGKRTPVMDDGYVMRENEFNRAVADLLEAELKRCGFRTLQVAPELTDTSLATGVKRANDAKADLFLSIHANANTGVWGTWGGVETLAGVMSGETLKIAQTIHKHVVIATGLRNRGVKDGSWLYEAKHTKMSHVLFELGFMDNKTEAKLLRSTSYRKACAVAIAKGVCEYYGVAYKFESAPTPTPKPTPIQAPTSSVHIVKSGDTLWALSRTYKLSVAELKALNSLKSDTLSIGQKLVVSKVKYHIVQKGDTLWAIARKYNISVNQLKAKNGLKNDVINPGDKLIVS